MDIIIDVTRVVRRVTKKRMLTGIDRVTLAYVAHYGNNAQALVRCWGYTWLLSLKQSKYLFNWILNNGPAPILLFLILKSTLLPKNREHQEDVFLFNTGHIGLNHSGYKRLIKRQRVKPIFFVHDLIPIMYPEYCSPGEEQRHRAKIDYLLELGYGIITNSQGTLNELQEYTKKNHQQLPPATSALLGSVLLPRAATKRPIDNPFFVILSTIEPRKNHTLLLTIWRKLYKIWGTHTPHLYVIGKRGWECENVIDLLERSNDLTKVVTEISDCSDSDLITYLAHCQALLFPSFAEGYGLPLIEALGLGAPVIASNLSVFHEIAGDVPEYIDPLDGQKWEQMILEYAQPKSIRRKNQLQRLKNLQLPQWENHFKQVNSFLTELKDPNHSTSS